MTSYDPIDGVNELVEGNEAPVETPAERTRQLLIESAPSAIFTIAHIAAHGTTERVQLDAAKYIVDKVLGKDSHVGNTSGDPLDKMLEQLLAAK